MYTKLRFKMLSLALLHMCIFLNISFISAKNKDGEKSVSTCPGDYFQCFNHDCIQMKYVCDDKNDCESGEDEMDCGNVDCASEGLFKCDNGRCLSMSLVCNADNDCGDMSDENITMCGDSEIYKTTACKNKEFKCDYSSCIPDHWVCDGVKDCPDGSDELTTNCMKESCSEEEFECQNKICIPKEWRCDGSKDCTDASDEVNCPRRNIHREECLPDKGKFSCKDGFCIKTLEVCDGHDDCIDGSDEGGNCTNKHMCDGICPGINETCIATPKGPICACAQGFERNKNTVCVDINECMNYGQCDQKCDNTNGTYYCFCDRGYVLQKDGRTCKADFGEPMLLFSSTSEIRVLHLSTQVYRTATTKQNHIIGVAYDGEHIYWTDVNFEKESILRSREDGTDREVIVSAGVGTPEGLAIDWITKNIYFTDSQLKRIGVCTNDGLFCTVIHAKNLDKPRGIALHPQEGLMYWSDWGKNPVIMRSGMDGSLATEFVNDSLHWPNGIVIDYSNERLYWVDAKLLTLESIKLNGKDRRKILTTSVKHPFSIAIFEDSLYWSDWEGNEIEACNKFTGKERRSIIRETSNKIYGIHIYHPVVQNHYLKNPCKSSPCSNICLLTPKSNPKRYKCACSEEIISTNSDDVSCATSDMQNTLFIASKQVIYRFGHKKLGRQETNSVSLNDIGEIGAITYNPVKGNLIFSDILKRNILTFDLESFKVTNLLVGGTGRVEGLAYDHFGDNLYFVDTERGRLEVLSLTTGNRKILLQYLGGDIPTDVVVVPEKGYMFVSFFNPRGSHIDRFSMTGNLAKRIHVVEDNMVGPSLSLEYDAYFNRVFWADSGSKSIESTDLEGTNRHIFRALSTSPSSLASIDGDLFWTNFNSHQLYWADATQSISGNKIVDLGAIENNQGLKLTAVTGNISNVQHPCRKNNGGCSHLCLADIMEKQCACPDGMVLDKDGRSCSQVENCEKNQFLCHLSTVNGKTRHCIPIVNRCDATKDCPKGEDELDCKEIRLQCPRGKVACLDGSKCIDEKEKCNSIEDCFDGSDELFCPNLDDEDYGDCSSEDNFFKCNSGECIPDSVVCDRIKHCSDGSDEKDCGKRQCTSSEFQCKDGSCITEHWACDLYPDCMDGSDENIEYAHCDEKKTCTENQMKCENGQCLDILFHCNGITDCDDGSDEKDCPEETATVEIEIGGTKPIFFKSCNSNEFKCYTEFGKCVPEDSRCNGTTECPNNEDEIGCGFCEEFECENTNCITIDWICDGSDDCGDNSDESTYLCNKLKHEVKTTEDICDEFLCANKKCVRLSEVCDGKDNCGDGTDEGGKCGFTCKNSACMDECHETPNGPKCSCQPGYTLMGDAKTCTDVDECLIDEYCSQYCENQIGSFKCSCKHPEYVLKDDQLSCKAKGEEMQFLFAYQNQIRTTSISHSSLSAIYVDDNFNFRTSGLAYDYNRRKIFWTSDGTDSLYRLHMDEPKAIENVTLSNPGKVAVDWITGNVYAVENGNQITICNFDSQACATIYTVDSKFNIDAMAVDPISRTVFWSERLKISQPFSKIYKSDLSGANVTEVVSKSLEVVSSIFIDTIHKYLYWAESNKQHIERSDFNGLMRQTVFVSPDIPIDVALFEDHAYFLVESNSIIRTHNLETQGNVWKCGVYGAANLKCELIRISPIHFGLPYHFEIIHEALQLKELNHCRNSTCDGLCVLRGSHPKCLCSDGSVIRKNGTCASVSMGKAFGDLDSGVRSGTSDQNRETSKVLKYLLILVVCLVVPGFILFLYFNKKLSGCSFPHFGDQKLPFQSIHFENTSYGHSPVVMNSHSESQFHHAKLSPDEHQFENPMNKLSQTQHESARDTKESGKSTVRKEEALIEIEDCGSETSSIEYSDVHLDNHKLPLIS